MLQKLPSRQFSVTTRIDVSQLREGERSGLLMMGRDYSYLAVTRDARGVRVVRVVCLDAPKGGVEKETGAVEVGNNLIYLHIDVMNDAVCRFSYSTNGKLFLVLSELFTAQPGMWIGAKVGLFSIASANAHGYAEYDWVRFAPRMQPKRMPITVPAAAPIIM